MPTDQSLSDFVASVAATDLPPSGGSVAAHAAALSAQLSRLVAGITIGRKRYASVDAEMRALAHRTAELVRMLSALVDRDAAACVAMRAAVKMAQGTGQDATMRAHAISTAMVDATEVPMEIARLSVEACQLAATAAEKGNRKALAESAVAALLAEASCRGAA